MYYIHLFWAHTSIFTESNQKSLKKNTVGFIKVYLLETISFQFQL